MSWLLVTGLFAARAVAFAGTSSTAGAVPDDNGAVYRYRDSAGVDHYVNHPQMVPRGVASVRVDLGADDLNPELAREIADNAHRAAEEAKAKAAEELKDEAAAAKGTLAEPRPPPIALPPEARLALIWAIAFTVVFFILWLGRGLLLRLPSLAVAFQPVRWGCGAAALLSWILVLTLARGWIVDHFAPLRSVKQAQMSVDKINREQRDSERELDKALNNGK